MIIWRARIHSTDTQICYSCTLKRVGSSLLLAYTKIHFSTPTDILLKESNDLSIHQSIANQTLLLTYKITHSNKPQYFAQKIKLKIPSEGQIFPQRQSYTLPMKGTHSITRTGFCYRAARLYNSLPLQSRRCQSENIFNRRVVPVISVPL